MRTYFIHGKITPTGFHMTASLNRKPPKGYYFIIIEDADTIKDALQSIVKATALTPANNINAIKIPPGVQASFIKD